MSVTSHAEGLQDEGNLSDPLFVKCVDFVRNHIIFKETAYCYMRTIRAKYVEVNVGESSKTYAKFKRHFPIALQHVFPGHTADRFQAFVPGRGILWHVQIK